jgi:hypothetical protein
MRHPVKGLQSLMLGALMSLGAASVAHAGLTNDVPSCYAANKIVAPQPQYDHLIYVLVDQTVALDPTLQRSVLDNMTPLLQPGTKFVIAAFSAFSQGHYLNVLHSGVIEHPLSASAEGDVPMSRVRELHTCLQQQVAYAQRLALGTTAQVLKTGSSSLDQSDIMMALKSVSSAIAQDNVPNRVVFVVTDALENSSLTSFYAHNAVRHISPAAELKKATDGNLFGDFGGARVFVLGAAVMATSDTGSQSQRNGYRDPATLMDLQRFWEGYFQHSNAKLVEFGAPALLEPVSW